MIDIMRTVFVAADEYEMRYGKRPVLFINQPLFSTLMADKGFFLNRDNMLLYDYPVKLVYDDSDEMHFWVGEQKPIYGKEN